MFFPFLEFPGLYQIKKSILREKYWINPFMFFVFHFSRCFGKPKETKKNNPVERILGKSIQDCFCGVFVFFVLEVFAV